MNKEKYTTLCGKILKTKKGFENHSKNCIKCNRRNDLPKKKKLKIPHEFRAKVFEHYTGIKCNVKCFCCWDSEITPYTNYNTFHAGHIKSEFNGGKIELDNILPICGWCNRAMGTMHWDEFVKKYKYPIRTYGGNIPETTHNIVKKIQIWWRNNKKNKKIKIKNNKKIKIKNNKNLKKRKNYENYTISFKIKCKNRKKRKKCFIWK